MNIHNWLTIFFSLCFIVVVIDSSAQKTIRVLDKASKEPLAFALIQTERRGAIVTNEDGYATIGCNKGQNVEISYLGYSTLMIECDNLISEVYLDQIPINFDVIIIGFDEKLYRIVAAARQNMLKKKSSIKRAYLSLSSYKSDVPIERINAYYNAEMYKGSISSLAVKNGKVVHTKDSSSIYCTLASNVFSSINLSHKSNVRLESLPSQLTFMQLKNKYYLYRKALIGADSILQIGVEPTNNDNTKWYGSIWINLKSNEFVKMKMECTNLKMHPFLPIFKNDEIGTISPKLEINIENSEVESIHFDYDVSYIRNVALMDIKDTVLYKTQGYLLIQSGAPYILPTISYDENYDEYRKIALIPYNERFWNGSYRPILSKEELSADNYLRENGIQLDFSNQDFFEHSNIVWQKEKRWTMLPKSTSKAYIENGIERKYHLDPKIIFDLNEDEGGFYFKSTAIIDIFKTKYSLPQTPQYNAFLNIYFDLLEYHRRQMELEMHQVQSPTEALLTKKYEEWMIYIQDSLKQYLNDVNAGEIQDNFFKYNELIKSSMGIDNFKFFNFSITTK